MAIDEGDFFVDRQGRGQTALVVDRARDEVLVKFEDTGESRPRSLSVMEGILDRMSVAAGFPALQAAREEERARRLERAAEARESRPDWSHGADYRTVVRLLTERSYRFIVVVPPLKQGMFEDDYLQRTGRQVDWTNRAIHLLPKDSRDGDPLNKKHYSTVISFSASPEEAEFVALLSPQIREWLHGGERPGTYTISCNALSRELLGLGLDFALGPQKAGLA